MQVDSVIGPLDRSVLYFTVQSIFADRWRFFFDRGSIGFLRISHDVSSKGGCKTNRTILRNRYIAYIACIMTE